MKFALPRRHRKNFEVSTQRNLSDNFNKNESLEAFQTIKKEYENSPETFGSSSGKKESQLELLIIVANQIISEYKGFEITLNKGIPEIIEIKIK
tara:strand:- start:1000 stop:1281 length:282 start_codon:yes stop_codon:yes gene_type:complete